MNEDKENKTPVTGSHLIKPSNHGAGCACCNPLADDEFEDGAD